MANDIVVKVENLSKLYRLYNSHFDRLKESLSPLRRKYHQDFYALKNVSFSVSKGETIGIIGKNGSGKSTLLKLVTGVLVPSEGAVFASGKISALLELGAGFNPELTGLENVFFNGTLMGYTKNEMNTKLDGILSFADIGKFVNQPVKTYSSGMFVRLAFAVAVNVSPEILIVDEALAVGDMKFQKKCKEVIHEKKESGTTIILVSHSMADVRSMCNKVLYLKNGHCDYFGDPCEAISKYYYDENTSETNEIEQKTLSTSHHGDSGWTEDIRITNVKCYELGNPYKTSDIEFGKNIVVEMEYEAINKIEKPIFRVNLSVPGYKYLVNFDSTETLTIDSVIGKGVVVLEINKPNLYPQAYSVNVGVVDSKANIKYFYWSEAAKFVVVSPKDEYLLHPTSIVKLDGSMNLLRG